MTSEENGAAVKQPRQAPGVVAPTTRVNLALPFSKITVEEPGKEVAELAAIVAGLAAAMAETASDPGLPELRKRADALVARLRRLSLQAAVEPAEAVPGQGEREGEVDRGLGPLEGPVPAGGLETRPSQRRDRILALFPTLALGKRDYWPCRARGRLPSKEVKLTEREVVMFRVRAAVMAFALLGLSAGTITTATAGAAAGAVAPVVPALTQISATHHYGYDELVFQFRGGVPAQYSARYVSQVIADPSGLPVNVVGSALLQVRFSPAAGHNAQGLVTYGAAQRTYALPELIQVVKSGDFESVLSFGVGVAQKATFTMYAQPRLGRVVLDIRAPYRTVPVRDYFMNTHRFAAGHAPYTEAVYRSVIPPATVSGALQRLFAGPTQAELARGLKFVSSGATGFKILSIRDGVARVQLTGKLSSGGSTFTIASEIMPTLKQFGSVHWVKIYDQSGHTERPFGHSDSIPFSLEP